MTTRGLDLKVSGPDGEVLPTSALGTGVDSINNVERIVIPSPTKGKYTVTVTGVDDVLGTAIDDTMNTAMFTGVPPAATPGAEGDIVITEILYNAAGDEGDREWVELHNPSTDTTYSLFECVFSDGSTDTSISALILRPGEYAVLGGPLSEADPVQDFDFALSNGGEDLTLSCGGTTPPQFQQTTASAFLGSTSHNFERTSSATQAATIKKTTPSAANICGLCSTRTGLNYAYGRIPNLLYRMATSSPRAGVGNSQGALMGQRIHTMSGSPSPFGIITSRDAAPRMAVTKCAGSWRWLSVGSHVHEHVQGTRA